MTQMNDNVQKPILTIGIPTRDPGSEHGRWRPEFGLFLRNLKLPDDFEIVYVTEWGGSVSIARETILKKAIAGGARYLLFLNDDILAPSNVLVELLGVFAPGSNVGAVCGTPVASFACCLLSLDFVRKMETLSLGSPTMFLPDLAKIGCVVISKDVGCQRMNFEAQNTTEANETDEPVVFAKPDIIEPVVPEPVTIIVPCWNSADLTTRCLKAVFRFTDYPFKIITIDNGSSDKTAKVLEAFGVEKIVTNEENLGWAIAINQGIEAAKTELVCFLDNTTEVTEGWLSRMVDCMTENVGAVAPTTNLFGGPQNILNNTGNRQPQETDYVVGMCLLTSKKVLSVVGVLDETFGVTYGGDDIDFALRLGKAGFRKVIARDVYVNHKGHADVNKMNVYKQDPVAWYKRGVEALIAKHGLDDIKKYLPTLDVKANLSQRN